LYEKVLIMNHQDQKKVQLTKTMTLENLEKIIRAFSSIFDAEFVLLDDNGIIYNDDNDDNDDSDRFIELIKKVKMQRGEPLIDESQGVFIQPVWLRETNDFFVGAIYVHKIKKEQYSTLINLNILLKSFIEEIVYRNIEVADTVKSWINAQNSLKRLYNIIDTIGKENDIQKIIQKLSEDIIKYFSGFSEDQNEKVIIMLKEDSSEKMSVVKMSPQDDSALKSRFNRLPHWFYEQLFPKESTGYSQIIIGETNNDLINKIDPEIKKLMAIPFPPKTSTPMGLICVITYDDNRNFFANDERFISTLTIPAAMAIKNIKLSQEKENEAWREISFRAGHKISNILFGLNGEINWLREIIEDEPLKMHELEEAITEAENSLYDARIIVKELKGFLKPGELNKELINVNDVIKKAIRSIDRSVKNVHIETNLEENLPEILIDISKIKHVISELIENAYHFLEKGTISIASRYSTNEDFTEIGEVGDSENYLTIEVKDTGPGISEKDKHNVFQPLFSSRGEGTGLGLAIVHKNISIHNGYIKEVGIQGEGAIFLILLPFENLPNKEAKKNE